MSAEIAPIYDTNRTKLSTVIPLDTPYSVYVFPTNVCNFKCVYCAHSLELKEMKALYDFSKETMSLDTYKNVIEQLSKFPKKIKLLSLTGQGEPLLNKNIAKMVKIAKDSNAFERVEIISNASLLTPEMSDSLIESGLDTLRISMQGLSAKKYREVCKFDIKFETLMNNIKYLYTNKKNMGLFVKILDIALEDNEEEKFYEMFSDRCDKMFVEKMQPTYSGVKITDDLDADYDRYGRITEKREVCPLTFYMLGILPNGDIKPCDAIYKPIIFGNISSSNIVDVWNSTELHNFWLMHLKYGKSKNGKCAVCSAPNDVSQPEDLLDLESEVLYKKLKGMWK